MIVRIVGSMRLLEEYVVARSMQLLGDERWECLECYMPWGSY